MTQMYWIFQISQRPQTAFILKASIPLTSAFIFKKICGPIIVIHSDPALTLVGLFTDK